MNISKTAKAFAIAAVVGLTSQVFGATTIEWWSQDFDEVADMDALTNVNYSAVGQWSTVEGDESSIVEDDREGAEGKVLKLDTQGNNLTWTPAVASTSVVVLVDADIFLRGSETDPTGFDPNNDVQTAVFLRNYVDEDTSLTTNSVLCAYVEDSENNNAWVELDGVEMVDTNWYSIRIEVDYSSAKPVARFYVDDTLLYQRGAPTTIDEFSLANNSQFATGENGFVRSVSFRGTGAIDNFVGSQVMLGQAVQLTFSVETYTDNVEDGEANVAAWSGATVNQGAQFWVTFNVADVGLTKYLTVVRVYTNATQYVDYDVNWDGTLWTIPAPLYYDGAHFGIRIDIDTTSLTEGYLIQAFYGEDPDGGGEEPVEPDPENPPVIGSAGGETPPVAFELIEGVEYFSVTFIAPQAGIVYSLQTQVTLGGAWTDETDELASKTSTEEDEVITLKAHTDGATTKFFRVKASAAPAQ